MTYRVFKFGGSSLADASCLENVSNIIQGDGRSLVVVVSAMGGVTNVLEDMARQAVSGRRGEEESKLHQIVGRHKDVIDTLLPSSEKAQVVEYLENSVAQLSDMFRSIETLGELTPKVLARIMAFGERMMALILSEILQGRGVDATHIDACEFMKLTKKQGHFVPDLKKSEGAVHDVLVPLLNDGKTIVVPGFIGEAPDGDVMTLGRGGSDYSATQLSALLNADSVTLYKEVDGLLTSDPRHVQNTRVVPELHYREAAELAYYGAKILHPRAIIPLIPRGIPLTIKNTFMPHLPGTLIAGNVSPGLYPVKALTAIEKQCLISVEGNGMMGVPGIAGRTFSSLAGQDISVSLITQASSESSICFVVPEGQAEKSKEILTEEFKYELNYSLIDEIKIKPSQCIVAIVGLGMSGTHGIAARAFQCIHKQGININAIAQGSSELNISIVIEDDHLAATLNALHMEYRLDRIKALHQKDSGEVNVLIYGFGQIGQTLSQQLDGQKEYFKDKLDIKVPMVSLVDSSAFVYEEDGFEGDRLEHVISVKKNKGKLKDLDESKSISDLSKHFEESTYHKGILIDLTAEETDKVIEDALEHNLNIVLANKKPLAIPYDRYRYLFDLAKEKGLFIRYEATVGAGLPVLDTLEKLSETGDEVHEVLGCLSGTLGYLMTQMEDGISFSEAVRIAYENGYTEPDPREDLSGMDVARKALILSRTLGIEINMEDIALESLFPDHLSSDDPKEFIESLKSIDHEYDLKVSEAKKGHKVLRYVARLGRDTVSVGLEAVPADSPLGRLRGTANQLSIRTRRYDDNPLIVTGPGAGADVTAAGVLNDVIAIAVSQERG